MAVKVIIRNSCSRISMVIYSFFRVVVSFDRWDWLAISIRGGVMWLELVGVLIVSRRRILRKN